MPGSVIATQCAPACSPTRCWRRSQKNARSASISAVVPDFEENRYSVRAGSLRCCAASTAAGSVESRTQRSRKPRCTPSERRSTSGASDEPPMPQRTAWVKPAARTSSANWTKLLASGAMVVARSSQPRFRAIAPRATSSAVGHSAASFLQRRAGTSAPSSSRVVASTARAVDPSVSPVRCATNAASRRRPTVSTSARYDATNAATPSVSSRSVTRSRSTPACASCACSSRARSTAASMRRSGWP